MVLSGPLFKVLFFSRNDDTMTVSKVSIYVSVENGSSLQLALESINPQLNRKSVCSKETDLNGRQFEKTMLFKK